MVESAGNRLPPWLRETLIAVVLLLLVSGLTWFILSSSVYNARWEVLWERRQSLFQGWCLTLLVSPIALIIAIVVAVVLVTLQRTGSVVLRRACQAYVELTRGSPLLVLMVLGYFVLAPPFQLNDPVVVGTLVLAAFSAGYLAEIIRGGIESIAGAQIEASRAVGFTTWQTYRYVIVPQAVRRILPSFTGEFANLIKNSSLLMVISAPEFLKEGMDAASNTYAYFEIYIPVAIGYLIVTIPIAILARVLEAKYAYAT